MHIDTNTDHFLARHLYTTCRTLISVVGHNQACKFFKIEMYFSFGAGNYQSCGRFQAARASFRTNNNDRIKLKSVQVRLPRSSSKGHVPFLI